MAAQASEAVNEAYNRLIVKSQEPELREYYEAREMWIIDQAIRESEARKEGREEVRCEVITCLNDSGVIIESIVEVTGLTPKEIRGIIGK